MRRKISNSNIIKNTVYKNGSFNISIGMLVNNNSFSKFSIFNDKTNTNYNGLTFELVGSLYLERFQTINGLKNKNSIKLTYKELSKIEISKSDILENYYSSDKADNNYTYFIENKKKKIVFTKRLAKENNEVESMGLYIKSENDTNDLKLEDFNNEYDLITFFNVISNLYNNFFSIVNTLYQTMLSKQIIKLITDNKK